MDGASERLVEAGKALAKLQELASLKQPSTIERDAAIIRFTYTFEAVWKAAREYLATTEGQEVASPKTCIRVSRRVGLLSDEDAEAALKMTDDRNWVVHTYKEDLAREIFERLERHTRLLEAWLAAMRRGPQEG